MTTTLVATLKPESGLVTSIGYIPPGMAGAMQLREVALTKVTLVQAMSPTLTVAPLTKAEPVMVRLSPPERLLAWMIGLTAVTIGGVPEIALRYHHTSEMVWSITTYKSGW